MAHDAIGMMPSEPPPFFEHQDLLRPPITRAAYSDRTAWLMAEMSRLASVTFEQDAAPLRSALARGGFELVQTFNAGGTQAFLAKRLANDMAVLAFRGTEQNDLNDLKADLDARFYRDEHGVRVHNGFHWAFEHVRQAVVKAAGTVRDHALYIAGHSLGGALALMAVRALSGDHVAACYTFGSPRVGNQEFDDDIKPPIYRVVNAYDPVPTLPPDAAVISFLALFPWQRSRAFLSRFAGYSHHGHSRWLTPCRDDMKDLDVVSNHNEWRRLIGVWQHGKDSIKDHSIQVYSKKLGYWALKRRTVI